MKQNSEAHVSGESTMDVYRKYMSQFVDDYLIDVVTRRFKVKVLAKKLEQDEHLNNIPLKQWDNMAYVVQSYAKDKQRLKEANDFYSLSHGVSVLKEAARIAVERHNATQ
jgi:hypothetical protein